MTPESKVKKRLTEGLDELHAYWFYPATHGYGRSGVPDIIACINGKFFGFECKADGNAPTALQVAEITKIREAGGYAYVVTGYEGVDLAFQVIEALTGRKRVQGSGRVAKQSGRSAKVSRLRAD